MQASQVCLVSSPAQSPKVVLPYTPSSTITWARNQPWLLHVTPKSNQILPVNPSLLAITSHLDYYNLVSFPFDFPSRNSTYFFHLEIRIVINAMTEIYTIKAFVTYALIEACSWHLQSEGTVFLCRICTWIIQFHSQAFRVNSKSHVFESLFARPLPTPPTDLLHSILSKQTYL